jgi:cell wall-associated NlpC family hydrolase
MTRVPHPPKRGRTRLRRLAAGALVAGSVVVVTTVETADARPRTKSAVVAAHADRALAALSSWESTHSPTDYVRFVQARQSTALVTAAELEIDGEQLRLEWENASTERQQTVLAALSQLGVPYRSLKSIPNVAFDCSGLTTWAYDQAGVDLPRYSRDQFRAADEVELHDAEAGDLVYYPGHVGIFLGVGAMIHSPNSGSHVEAVTLSTRKRLRFGDVMTPAAEADAVSAVQQLPALVDRAAPVSQ